MEKIYIPTSTLNFNSIMATESLSPKSFYKNRQFGYKRFSMVDPNPFENSLIGYSKIPKFSIDDTGLDDYPLIIEISKDIVQNKIQNIIQNNGIEIYQLDSTIYLHPNRVKFLFFSTKEKDICLIKSEPSIETKLIPFYNSTFQVIDSNTDSFQWKERVLKSLSDFSDAEIKNKVYNDLKLNRLKGFYYCYQLGIIKTKTKNKQWFLNKKDDIKNKICSSIDNNDFVLLEENVILFKKIAQKYEQQKHNFIINFSNFNLTQLDDDFIDAQHTQIYRNIINELVAFPIYNIQSFLENKVELTLTIGNNFKEAIYNNWEGSQEQNYINSLLDNLENHQQFDIEDIKKNEILQSIAIFILKGDDIEKLLYALEQNGIKDYRTAFGLWGAIFGFSALPKTITNILFEDDNINITQKLYHDVQVKLHSCNIDADIIIQTNDKKKIPKQNNRNLIQQEKQDIVPKCPVCGSEMVLKEPKSGDTWKAFYGCSKYKETGCTGSSFYPYSPEKEQKQFNNDKKVVEATLMLSKKDIKDIVFDYLKKNGHSTINTVIDFISKETGTKYKNNKEFISFIEDDNIFEIKKLTRKDGIKLKT